MSLVVKVDGVTLTHRVRLRGDQDEGIPGLTSAADGSGSSGGIIIDDPNHDLVLQGWQTVTVEETDCSRPRLFTGFIGDRTMTHGDYPTAGGRQVNVTINDQNALLSLRLITGADGKRPKESRTARLDWLMASDYLDGIVFDTGFIVPSGTSDFDEADYRRQYPRDVLDDVLGAFQTSFAFWDDAADKVGLFYDTVTATTYDSTLSISNDPADWSSTCVGPYIDAELSQDPSGVYSLEDLTYTGGELIRSDPTTASTFFPSPYLTRGEATDRSRIGKPVTASDYVNALLAQGSVERETVTCTIRLPSTQVGLIDAGMRLSVKFLHLDGYEDFVDTRVTSRTTRQVLGRRDMYEVQLTLNQRAPIGGGGGGGGSNPPPTTFPPAPVAPQVVQTGCGSSLGGGVELVFDNPVSEDHIVVVGTVWRDGSTDEANVNLNPGGTADYVAFTTIGRTTIHSLANEETWFGYRVVTAHDLTYGGTTYRFGTGAGTGRPKLLAWEIAGVAAPNTHQSVTNNAGALTFPSLTISGAGMVIGVVGAGVDCLASVSVLPSNDHIYIENGDHFWQIISGWDDVRSAAGSIAYTPSGVACGGAGGDNTNSGTVAFFPSTAGTVPLTPGQPNIRPEVVAMSGVNGTTLWPFADGTLRVLYDIVDQTAAIVSYDGAAGTFVMPSAPPLGTQVFVEYLGR